MLLLTFAAKAEIQSMKQNANAPTSSRIVLYADPMECGYTDFYSIDPKKHSNSEKECLTKLLEFLFNSDIWPKGMNNPSPPKITTEEMKKLLTTKGFSSCAIDPVINELKIFANRREALLSDKTLKAGEDFFKQPVVKKYFESQWKIIDVLKERFDVQKTDNGLRCD